VTIPYAGFRIMATPHWPQVEDGTRTVRFECHPIIRWLARWLPIRPYVEATYINYKDSDMLLDRARGVVYCSLAQENVLRREIT